MKKKLLLSAMAVVFMSANAYANTASLPAPFEPAFESAMNNPHVVLYYADNAYRQGDYNAALRWMLNAAEYGLPAAVENSKFMIDNNLGTFENREAVIAFLEHIAQDRADQKGDLFAQVYLADYYRGDRCVWLNNTEKSDCLTGAKVIDGPVAGIDYKRSYFFYDRSADTNDRARYHVAMMDLLGLGAPRNVPFAVERLSPLAENGSAEVAFLLGEIYQSGYWVMQDRNEASKWYAMAAQKNHPAAMLALAQNYLRGVGIENEAERAHQARDLFVNVSEGILASDTQRAEAHYRLGLLYATHFSMKNSHYADKHMQFAAKLSAAEPNEFSVMAYHWLGKQAESTSHKAALEYYHAGAEVLDTLPITEQQKHAALWQSLAQLYGQGKQRSEAKFSLYMNQYHRAMSASTLANSSADSVFGYNAFRFPG